MSARCGYKNEEAAIKTPKGEQVPETIETGFFCYENGTINSFQDRGSPLRLIPEKTDSIYVRP